MACRMAMGRRHHAFRVMADGLKSEHNKNAKMTNINKLMFGLNNGCPE